MTQLQIDGETPSYGRVEIYYPMRPAIKLGETLSTKANTYFVKVVKAFAGELDKPFLSTQLWQKALDLEAAFTVAKEQVRILASARYSPELFQKPDVLTAAREFLGRGGHIDLLLEGASTEAAEFVLSLSAVRPGRLEANTVTPAEVAKYNYNLVMVDDKAYRFQGNRDFSPGQILCGPQWAQMRKVRANILDNLKASALPFSPNPHGTREGLYDTPVEAFWAGRLHMPTEPARAYL